MDALAQRLREKNLKLRDECKQANKRVRQLEKESKKMLSSNMDRALVLFPLKNRKCR